MDIEDSPSPFLPGTLVQFAWDSTTLGDFKTCAQYYYLTRIEGWQPNEESVHLRFGSLYQKSIEYYKRELADGVKHDDAVHDVVTWLLLESHDWWSDDEIGDMRGGAKKKTRLALVRSVTWRLDDYRHDPTKTYIMKDGSPAVELSFRFALDWAPQSNVTQPYILCGHLDEVVEFADELYGLDNKTTSGAIGPYYFEGYNPDNQMTLYTLATNVLLHVPVRGMIIDAAKIDRDTTTYSRGLTTRTQDSLDEWVDELHYWFALQEQFALSNKWPHNDRACGMYGGCRFREVCSQSPLVRNRFLAAAFTQLPPEERWNPLKSRTPSSPLSFPSPLRSERSEPETLETRS